MPGSALWGFTAFFCHLAAYDRGPARLRRSLWPAGELSRQSRASKADDAPAAAASLGCADGIY